MRVQWLGGPEDGDVIIVPDGARHITIPRRRGPIWDNSPITDIEIETIDLPIQSRVTPEGKQILFIRYPKERQ